MSIIVNVVNQHMSISSDVCCLVSGSQRFVQFQFILGPEWDGLKTFAQFRQGDAAYNDYLDANNCVYLPPEISGGTCTLMLYGSLDATIGTTNYLTFRISQNHLLEDASSTEISESLYNQLVSQVSALDTWNEQHLSELKAADKNLQIQINSKADTTKLMAEIARAIKAEDENASAISQKANQSDVDELTLKVAQLEQNEFVAEMINDAVAAEMARYLASGALANMTIEDGSVTRSKVDTDVAATLEKADSAMQPNVYDTQNLQSDVYLYAQAKADTVQDNLDTVKDEIRDAYALTDTVVYTNLGDAVRGAVDMANTYSQALLADYKPFSIKFVDELPNAGDPMVFYLVPNKFGTGYHKYWWITDASGVPQWDEFGNSSTIVVTELPETGDTNTDYIVQSGAGYLYYKWIDGYWETVAGCTSSVVSALPDVGNEYTDYYLLNADGYYTHYRWINGKYHAISSENGGSGTKEAFIVRLTESEDGQGLMADKSSIDAIAAYKAGRPVYCEYGADGIYFVLSVIQYFENLGTIVYGNVHMNSAIFVFHGADGNVILDAYSLVDETELQEALTPITNRLTALEQNSGTGGNAEKEVYIVNITNDNGTYKADKTFTEIFEAIQQNKIIQAYIEMEGNAFILPLCTITENLMLVYGGSAATTTLAIAQTLTGQINIITEELATKTYVDNAIANLPSGGSAIPKEMELIASGTNTEPVRRFKITTDNDGNAFELTKAYFVAANFVLNGSTTSKAISLEMGGDIIGVGTLQTDGDTKNKEIVAYANSDGVMLATQGRGGIYAQGEKFYFATNFKPNTTITKVDFLCADATQTFKAGATYELWGVRK